MNYLHDDDDLVYTLDVGGSFLYFERIDPLAYYEVNKGFIHNMSRFNKPGYFLTSPVTSAVTSIIDGIFPVISLTKCIKVFVTFENVK